MLLAGNGSSPSQSKQAPVAPVVEASVPRPATADGFIRSWSFPGLPSPISVTMRPDPQCAGGSNGTSGLAIAKSVGASASSSNLQLPEPPRVVSSVGPSTTTVIPAGITRFIVLNHLLLCYWCSFLRETKSIRVI